MGNFLHGHASRLKHPAIFVSGVHNKRRQPETVGNFHHGGGNPETVMGLHHGGAERLRRSAIVVSGVHKKRRQPETVVGFHHGGAERLRRSAIVVSGVHRKSTEPAPPIWTQGTPTGMGEPTSVIGLSPDKADRELPRYHGFAPPAMGFKALSKQCKSGPCDFDMRRQLIWDGYNAKHKFNVKLYNTIL